MHFIKTSAKFESAHRLVGYEGKCHRLHGHNWRVDFQLSGSLKDGMVADFSILKSMVKDDFDHRIILEDCTSNREIFEHFDSDWIKWVDFTPTAENLADYIAHKCMDWFENLEKVRIYVWENGKSHASRELFRKK